MPLNALWRYTALDHLEDLPWTLYVIWGITDLSFLITVIFGMRWALRNYRASKRLVYEERRMDVPHGMQHMQVLAICPFVVGTLACVTMFIPCVAYAMELNIAIFSSVIVGSTTRYFLGLIGEPPLPDELLGRTSRKKWWCGPACDGVNATCPSLGFFWSKEPHKIRLEDIHTARLMVQVFIWVYIGVNCATAGMGMVPTPIQQQTDGSCMSLNLLRGAVGKTMSALLWTASFVGMAGFSVITNGIASILDTSLDHLDDGLEHASTQEFIASFKLREKACTVQIYMLLPLLLPVLMALPLNISYRGGSIPVQITEFSDLQENGNWTTSGRTIECPIYDAQVTAHVIYACGVSVAMAYASVRNFWYYHPGKDTVLAETRMQEILHEISRTPRGFPTDSEGEEELSESDA